MEQETPALITSTEPLPFFVYGTLRPGGDLYHNIEYLVRRHEPAILPGFDLYMAGYPAIRPTEIPSRFVVGDLLWMRDHERALARCDAIEHYHPPFTTMYIRAAVIAQTDGRDTRMAAWAYLAGPGCPFDEDDRVPSGDYKIARPEHWLPREVPA
jgi:gamma-glutamylcyclotransferase (GGCT)/AIG2-like uncharacterized protein YtfP